MQWKAVDLVLGTNGQTLGQWGFLDILFVEEGRDWIAYLLHVKTVVWIKKSCLYRLILIWSLSRHLFPKKCNTICPVFKACRMQSTMSAAQSSMISSLCNVQWGSYRLCLCLQKMQNLKHVLHDLRAWVQLQLLLLGLFERLTMPGVCFCL